MKNKTHFRGSMINLKRKAGYALLNRGLVVQFVGRRGKERFPDHIDPLFVDLYRMHYDKTMVPWQGLYTAFQAAKYVALNNLSGSVVECGVWKGGCAMIMAETLKSYGDTSRDIYMYDTFAGMPEPTAMDTKGGGAVVAREKYKKLKKSDYTDWCYASYAEVKTNVAASSYPQGRFKLIRGRVEETIPAEAPDSISILRLDTDWYESTRHELEHLYPLLVEGGVLMADDFGAWYGARKAIQEYMAQRKKHMFLHLDYYYGAVSGIKRESCNTKSLPTEQP